MGRSIIAPVTVANALQPEKTNSFYEQLTGRLNRPITGKWQNYSDRSMSCLETRSGRRSLRVADDSDRRARAYSSEVVFLDLK